jgi:hypothetical protein
MGLMFLENWQPNTYPGDPRWGFSIAGRPAAGAIQTYLQSLDPGVAYPGYYLAQEMNLTQEYEGGWRFSPEYGADISKPEDGNEADRVTLTFWGTNAGLRVRRANFRARLYVNIDGEPANALPQDENGAALVLTSPDPAEDFLSIEPVASGLEPGIHTMEIVAARGWDQWALNGFSIGYSPLGPRAGWPTVALIFSGLILLFIGIYAARRTDWGAASERLEASYSTFSDRAQITITALAALLVVLTGWLTWGEQLAGMYRRLGDGGQLALTAAAASIFYITPSFFLYFIALAALFLLIYLRPAWGLALVAFTFPFYVPQLTKPIVAYRFSPVEVFMLVTFAAFALHWLTDWVSRQKHGTSTPEQEQKFSWHAADFAVLIFTTVATFSLLFTERLDVATNEWRLVIV